MARHTRFAVVALAGTAALLAGCGAAANTASVGVSAGGSQRLLAAARRGAPPCGRRPRPRLDAHDRHHDRHDFERPRADLELARRHADARGGVRAGGCADLDRGDRAQRQDPGPGSAPRRPARSTLSLRVKRHDLPVTDQPGQDALPAGRRQGPARPRSGMRSAYSALQGSSGFLPPFVQALLDDKWVSLPAVVAALARVDDWAAGEPASAAPDQRAGCSARCHAVVARTST